MDRVTLLENFHVISEAPGGVERLKDLVIGLGVRGLLVEQQVSEGTARAFIESVAREESLLKRSRPQAAETIEGHWSVPDSWLWVRLADVAAFTPGKTPSTKDATMWAQDGGTPWASIADMPAGGTITRTAKALSAKAVTQVMRKDPEPVGTLLMSFKLTIGKVCRLGVPAFHNEAIISIHTTALELDEYLFRFLPRLAPLGATKGAIKGNTLNATSLENLRIPLPPLAEQSRIVARVDELMGLCNELADALNAKRELAERLGHATTNLD